MADHEKRGLVLLVVDDDARILELVAHVASRSSHFRAVLTATSGADALAKIAASSALPDLILTDLSMPQMDGFDLVRALKESERTQHIPVFMFSSSGVLYDQQHALDVGCAAFFPKPATFAGLSDVFASMIRQVQEAAATRSTC